MNKNNTLVNGFNLIIDDFKNVWFKKIYRQALKTLWVAILISVFVLILYIVFSRVIAPKYSIDTLGPDFFIFIFVPFIILNLLFGLWYIKSTYKKKFMQMIEKGKSRLSLVEIKNNAELDAEFAFKLSESFQKFNETPVKLNKRVLVKDIWDFSHFKKNIEDKRDLEAIFYVILVTIIKLPESNLSENIKQQLLNEYDLGIDTNDRNK
ncbi:hypothetical protein H9M94_03360 [Mycoplasma sp. Pen4]|uniref:hypothetical protein n=1 Tax=Mycoplasma sp. Pen4 TaxID=640330 RepID=UPI00165465D2|nr:hypothetical protein [Mycoplasma sp. Pen4]QNM93610.1 hypothetical protein H9M94_03360 [Mycoplasma sp. Pen4]